MQTETQRHARAFASDLEAHAAALRAIIQKPLTAFPRVICDADPLLCSAAALIRDLASNALPDWESINTDRTLIPADMQAQVIAGWSEKTGCESEGARLMIASEWIKSRDVEIGDLRAKLARAVPFGAFVDARREPYAGEQPKSGALYSDTPTPVPVEICDGEHSLPRCTDPQCWHAPAPTLDPVAVLAELLPLLRQQVEDQRAHWQAMEHQTRRIADAIALRAITIYLDADHAACNALKDRINADALK